jgi:hypothetical protein
VAVYEDGKHIGLLSSLAGAVNRLHVHALRFTPESARSAASQINDRGGRYTAKARKL